MAGRRASRDAISREQWAAQISAINRAPSVTRPVKAPISVSRIVAAALGVIQTEGFDDLTMRRVATALQTGPSSLYAHVRNKSELDDLLIGELCSRVTIPTPDPAHWEAQFIEVCTQLREEFLRYPGIARAALAGVPSSLEALRVGEGMLGILLAAGIPPQSAAWASDAAFLYVTGYCLEAGTARRQGADADGRVIDRTEIMERLQMLPLKLFPNTVTYAQELTAGDRHERFDFTLELLLRGLARSA
jgi:AcrR family transcriptional regulator